MRTSRIAEQTSRTIFRHVEMPRPNLFDTRRSGSPVASQHTDTATLCRTGVAFRSIAFFFVTAASSSLQMKSNVALLIRNVRQNSSSGNWAVALLLPVL